MGSLATTIRFGEGLVDGVLTTTDGGDQLIIHRRGAEAEVIEPPASVQALNDLAACDLNGDGGTRSRWSGAAAFHPLGTGEWTQSPVSERPIRTQCASDISETGSMTSSSPRRAKTVFTFSTSWTGSHPGFRNMTSAP